MYISACFITKNEEKNIAKAINSLQGMYDELIVVDTGSIDATTEIAQKLGARVYHFEWRNDFSLARNFTIDKAKGDWIIFLDADEYYKGTVNIRDYLGEVDCNNQQGEAILVSLYEDYYAGNPPMRVIRLFRNRSYLRYTGSIHEVLTNSKERIHIVDAGELLFGHSGYHPDNMKLKSKRNLDLLLADIAKNGEKDAYYYYLAECYFGLQEYEKAIDNIQKAMASPVRHYKEEANYYHILLESMRSCNYSGEIMANIAAEAIAKFPDMPEFYGEKGIILSSIGKLDDAFTMLNKCVEKYEYCNRQSNDYGYFTDEIMGIIYARLARIALVQNKVEFAQIAAKLALRSSNNRWGQEEAAILEEVVEKRQSRQVVVCIPIYKSSLSIFEQISLLQLNKVLGKYKRVFIAPESLEYDFGECGEGIDVERFPDYFFKSIISYSSLLLDVNFYRRFQDYEYMLIYQTDAFVFSDRLEEFCNFGYDYIGAPMERANPFWNFLTKRVGNGGFSLRKISAAIRILEEWWPKFSQSSLISIFKQWEDIFWGYCGKQEIINFKVPPVKLAVEFAVQDNICHAYKRMQIGWRPFGCHGWNQMNYNDWRPIIETCGYNFPKNEDPGKEKYPRLREYIKSRKYVNCNYLWGLYRKGKFSKLLTVLDKWLRQYPSKYPTWQLNMENFITIFRIVDAEQFANKQVCIPCLRLLTKALRESLTLGASYSICNNLLITLVPCLKKYDYPPMNELARLICDHWWNVWGEHKDYNQQRVHGDGKKIVVLTQVCDEVDVVESFIRHTLTFADAILVDISLATNGSEKILRSLEKEGLPLILHDKVLRREEFKDDMDVVLMFSPDSFLLPQSANIDVRQELLTLDNKCNYVVETCNYTAYVPYAYQDKFFLSRPLLRHLPTKRRCDLLRSTNVNVSASYLANNLYMVIRENIYNEERQKGIIPADMELADIRPFSLNHKIKYTHVFDECR